MRTETSCYFGQGRAWLCEELPLKSVGISRTGGRGLQAWRKGHSRLDVLLKFSQTMQSPGLEVLIKWTQR